MSEEYTKVNIGGATILAEQWLKYKGVKLLGTALLKVGIQLDPQKVWDAIEPYRETET